MQRVMFTRGPRALWSVLCVGVAALLLTACTVKLVSDYDDQIDSGLTQLNTDVTAFVNKMIQAANTPAGTWANNKDFYTTQEAKVDTLIVRAEAHKALNSCPSTGVVAAAVKAAAPTSEATKYIDKIPQDDCSVVLLKLVKQGVVDLETFHKAQGSAGIPAAAHDPLLVGGVGSLIHSAITVEIAKKSGQTVSSTGGK